MEARVELLDLSTELLLCIAAFLPLEDLKAFGATCHHLAAVSTTAMQKRFVSLRISRYENSTVTGGPSMQVLPETILDGCHRSYHSIAVDCLMYETLLDFADLMSRPPIAEWEIKQLILKVFEPEAVASFIEMCSGLINSVTSMRVTVYQNSSVQYPEKEVMLEMPNLRELSWSEAKCAQFSFDPSYHRVSLVAPRLSILYLHSYGFKPGSLTIANNGGRSSAGYHTLEKLYIVLTEEVTNALRGVVLTKLETFVGKVSVQFTELKWFWESLTQRMPNLETLELHLMDNEVSMRYFCGLNKLRELVIRDGVINIEPGSEYHLDGMDKLCLKSSRIFAAQGTLHLPNLRTLCLSGDTQMDQHNNLDVFAPMLSYLYIGDNVNCGINFRNSVRIDFLHFVIKTPSVTIPLGLSLDFLTALYLDCRCPTFSNEFEHILSRTPNLKVLLLLLHGSTIDSIMPLPQWCPKLEHLYIQSHRGFSNFICFSALQSIFSLPAIEEIVIESLVVSDRADKPISIPHHLHTLVVQSLYFMMSQHTLLEVASHPEQGRFPIKQEVKHGMMHLSCQPVRLWPHLDYMYSNCYGAWCEHSIKQNYMLIHLAYSDE